ncbi:L-arabinose ABC transporter ATP-binding protein AraG [Mesorhizobium sp. RP14(2022)]|uniref:L-arabinose ABC transporter ATP-binding protein AraG n=1 Tax=Mesorhizobium liriopis TaxID=2953882 RepID=A0ABT1C3X2_9HYPH|nr:L-arabinose ABC transporter ATP-binding protein AraG [Mesorhizobium liriopis]MCO6049530.1 L-arabinose ABC transporter ATP-binding protein AraG [Mesorhizobium liriopis]
MAFLEFSDISKTYPGVKALSSVSFGVRKGSVHGLMGENGAGKSTLIRLLSGDQRADEGEIRIDGNTQAYASTRDAFDAGVVVVHQELQLVPELSVAENLRLGRFPARGGVVGFRALFEEVGRVLKEIGIDVDPRARVSSLSIGERQMIEIAKAVMIDARVLALDEPTSSLSSRESEVLFRLIDRLRQAGKVIIYVSHRLDEIFRLCDGCTVLRDGRLAAHHETMEVVTRDRLVSEMVGREIADIWGWRPRESGAVRLSVQGLHGPRVPEPASFEARAGEILGFFGLVGAGRSELMRLVYGADQPNGGSVALDGAPLALGSPRRSIRAGLVLCPEDRKADGIVQGRSVGENVVIASRRHYSPLGVINPRREASVADRFIEALRIRTPSRRQDIVNLSGGNQQKVILARWLSEPGINVLIVDEPTRGIDVGAKAEIYDILYRLAEQGVAIVVVSSELPEVMGISDRILVMCERRIAAEFKRGEFTEGVLLAAALPDRQTPQTAAQRA